MTIPSLTEALRLRAAIAKDQTAHWRRLFWEPAPSKKEADRREWLWFWWRSTGLFAELSSRGLTISAERSFARGR